jgi:hypothetical protein
MNDTSAAMELKMMELFSAKTPAERVAMGASMYDTSRMITEARLKREHPDWTPNELRREIFLAYYGDEFDVVQREKIAAWLMGANSKSPGPQDQGTPR